MSSPPIFLLDQDFPTSLLLHISFPDAIIKPLRDVHPDLVRNHEDWEVLRELKVRGAVDGLITLDVNMLNLPKEMVVLHQSRLSLVVFEGIDNDPTVATGLLMIHLPTIARQHNPAIPQLWRLHRPVTKPPANPWEQIILLAARANEDPDKLARQHRLPSRTFLR